MAEGLGNMNKIKVGILGATGTVGQRFVQLLQGHPWFVGTQFHPEFHSRLCSPHPLFTAFIGAALQRKFGT